ncbi:tetratricopeptide repeat protein [Erythrobacter sp. Alg231-14]|uniref:tetratricopeptide repeat protein n=1 Tax=Erythrobacter sp. Alg231-14 TaxID=1922225 RepID=UPI000D55961E
MNLLIKTPIALTALFAATAAIAQPVGAPVKASSGAPTDAGLAAVPLSNGESDRAITMLRAELEQYPGDSALLINLGIAYAQAGDAGEARSAFEAAMSSRHAIDLETADGATMDSRRVARRALSMLDRGAFGNAARNSGRLSLNQQ